MTSMSKLKRLSFTFILLAAAQLLTACGVLYKPSPFWGANGYSSKDIDENKVSVSYLTGATASADLPKVYVLYRCAEIAQERGFDSFFLIEAGSSESRLGSSYISKAYATMQMYQRNTPASSDLVRDASNGYLQLRKGAKYFVVDVKAGLEKSIKRE
ncbi:MAG: hypothetical protein K2Y28_13620 [Burkholderiaceae bacterium]|nr:hypothetical protein [Burkholderiaceae bacterium]